MYYGLLSGNPVRIGPGPNFAEIVDTHGIDFGMPHEMGHDFDFFPHESFYMGDMAFDGPEHWADLKVLYAYDQLGERYPELTQEMWGQTVPLSQVGQLFIDETAQPWIDSGRTDYENVGDAYTGLNYVLRQSIGWEPFKAAFRDFRARSQTDVPSNDLDKVELWANTLSDYAGVNLVPTFQSWGFPIERHERSAYTYTSFQGDTFSLYPHLRGSTSPCSCRPSAWIRRRSTRSGGLDQVYEYYAQTTGRTRSVSYL